MGCFQSKTAHLASPDQDPPLPHPSPDPGNFSFLFFLFFFTFFTFNFYCFMLHVFYQVFEIVWSCLEFRLDWSMHGCKKE